MKRRSVAIGLVVFSSFGLAQQIRKPSEVDDKQAEREEWFYSQRAYPLGRIPTGARLKGIAEIDRIDSTAQASAAQALEPNSLAPRALQVASWMSIGPQPDA